METGPKPTGEEIGEGKRDLEIGQRVSFVEGETLMGRGENVVKYGRIVDIKRDTVGIEVEDTGLQGTKMIVRVSKEGVEDAPEETKQ